LQLFAVTTKSLALGPETWVLTVLSRLVGLTIPKQPPPRPGTPQALAPLEVPIA
jgi:hypothetical protein